jgi:REP element-mobilizing transposase RayT
VSSALARAQEHCAENGLPPVEVFAVVVMSNHLHLVVRAPGKNLAAFMGYFLARVAQTLNLLLGRVGPVFPRRYDAQPVLDEEAAAGRIKYVCGARTGVATPVPTAHVRPHGRSIRVGAPSLRVAA